LYASGDLDFPGLRVGQNSYVDNVHHVREFEEILDFGVPLCCAVLGAITPRTCKYRYVLSEHTGTNSHGIQGTPRNDVFLSHSVYPFLEPCRSCALGIILLVLPPTFFFLFLYCQGPWEGEESPMSTPTTHAMVTVPGQEKAPSILHLCTTGSLFSVFVFLLTIAPTRLLHPLATWYTR
jgi:hypothetical protein